MKKILCWFGIHDYRIFKFQPAEDGVGIKVGAAELKKRCNHCYLVKTYWFGEIP